MASQNEKLILIFISIFTALGVWLAVFNLSYFDTVYTLEDGFIEWITTIALGSTAIVCVRRLIRGRRQKNAAFFAVVGFMSFCFIFGAGEELSWGQRLLNLESSEFFQSHNAQSETNLHNLKIGDVKLNKLIFGKGLALAFLLYLGVLTPLYYRNAKVRHWMDRLAVPIPRTYQVAGYVLVLLATEGLIQYFSETGRRGEITEFSTSLLVMLNIIYPKNRQVFEVPAR